MKKALFLDRDGVINIDKSYLYKREDFEFIEGIFEVCRHAQSLGYAVIVVTNQSGIGRGYYSEADFQKLTQWMLKRFHQEGVTILDLYHCPHTPQEGCDCRKPKPGMILTAQKAHHINLKASWIIGDKESDIEAGINAGIPNTIRLSSQNITSNAHYLLGSLKEVIAIIKT